MYQEFVQAKKYSVEYQKCIQETVDKLIKTKTKFNDPIMLLGKVQSGKTRTFIGVMALAMERGYDICIVLTKGTIALARQTQNRLEDEFADFIDNDIIKVYDIMNLPKFTSYIKNQKLIFVVKKENKNLEKLVNLFEIESDLAQKRVLFVDDEADFASVGYRNDKNAPDGYIMNVIPKKINDIRSGFENRSSYLQVTATPNALYLQTRGKMKINNNTYLPIKPSHTSLVPVHEKYIGGKQYFEESQDSQSLYSKIFIGVPDSEIDLLNTSRDKITKVSIRKANQLHVFSTSIINYLTGSAIRILQSKANGVNNYKSSFIFHINKTIKQHDLQKELADIVIEYFEQLALNDKKAFRVLVGVSYNNLIESVSMITDNIPSLKDVEKKVFEILIEGHIGIVKVNSETEIFAMLDKKGQLRLDNPLNIFIGGGILDRGITIENLIGFFYGRNPKTFQQDTVLQHSRMYGARKIEDMAVTRLYTSNRIYAALKRIHRLDDVLRTAIENGMHKEDNGVVFVESDDKGEIKPCAPNKIIARTVESIKGHSRFLPYGFQIRSKQIVEKLNKEILDIILNASNEKWKVPFLISIEDVIRILNLIENTYVYNSKYGNEGLEWDSNVYKAILERLDKTVRTKSLKGKIWCYVAMDRETSRTKGMGLTFSDAPDDGKTDLKTARKLAQEVACLSLFYQKGLDDGSKAGWNGTPFWWPVVLTPANAEYAVFARGEKR